jgi:hypothetical protein
MRKAGRRQRRQWHKNPLPWADVDCGNLISCKNVTTHRATKILFHGEIVGALGCLWASGDSRAGEMVLRSAEGRQGTTSTVVKGR